MSHAQALSFYKQKKYEKAFLLWKDEVDSDNDQAMVNIGLLYLKGEGVAQDARLAKEWFEKAIVQGNTSAYYNLALMYQNEIGVEKDNAIAIENFKKASLGGHSGANLRLGMMMLEDKSNKELLGEGFEYLLRSAKGGNPIAISKIGGIGRGVDIPDEQKNSDFRAKGLDSQVSLIQDAIDEHIKPILLKDGGDIIVLSVEASPKVEIRMLYGGNCSGCSLATTGTYEIIRTTLVNLIDEEIDIYVA